MAEETESVSGGFTYLGFAKEVVMIETEMTSYSELSLLADIGGSLGMFLGFFLPDGLGCS